MKQVCGRLFILLSFLGVLGFAPLSAQCAPTGADSFESRPIRWIVPYSAGGPTGMVARVVAERLSERLKQAVLVENVAGAFGNIGMGAGARAAPDGHTIVFAATSMVRDGLRFQRGRRSRALLRDHPPAEQ